MPEATPFSALRFLPFCAEKVNVSPYDYWVTLGNTQKGNSPSASEIALSLQNAMALYWNLYAINGTIDENTTSTDRSANAVDNLSDGKAEPYTRVCPESSKYGMHCEDVETCFDAGTTMTDGNSTIYSNLYDTKANIVRMYDGVTTDETNYVGLGLKSDVADGFMFNLNAPGMLHDYYTLVPFVSTGCFVYICSYGNDPGISSATEVSGIGYTTISSIPVLCTGWAGNVDASNPTPTVDPTNRSATGYNGLTYYHTVSLDSLEFYTYP
jgi:hypothetical protein